MDSSLTMHWALIKPFSVLGANLIKTDKYIRRAPQMIRKLRDGVVRRITLSIVRNTTIEIIEGQKYKSWIKNTMNSSYEYNIYGIPPIMAYYCKNMMVI